MNKLLMPYEAPELFLISVRVEKGFAVSSDIEPGEGGGELGYDPGRGLALLCGGVPPRNGWRLASPAGAQT